jgi:cold shock CspA family protein
MTRSAPSDTPTLRGTVTHVIVSRGFAFISSPQCSQDVFAHAKQFSHELPWDETLQEREVEFELETQPDGRQRARNIRAAR